ncbi:MAG: hypothetical protein GY820_41230 [Gammaproteobacteria bacterium]|nr:hypothetical protein [Gammaproteobacteria bacterium]
MFQRNRLWRVVATYARPNRAGGFIDTAIVHSGNSIARIRRLRLIAIAPLLIVATIGSEFHYLPVFAVALLCAGFWERVFAEQRGRKFDVGVIYTALLFSLLMPPDIAMFHVMFGMSFAMVFAHGVFGGEGKAFLNPALVAAAVVLITFPASSNQHVLWTAVTEFNQVSYGLMDAALLLSIVFGAAVLITGRLVSWRLLAGHVIGSIALGLVVGGSLDLVWYGHLLAGSFIYAVVFIASDPSASSATNTGRWVQGILAGALVVLLREVNPSHADGVIPALLLMSMAAPLIDQIVIWFNIRRRGRARG